MAQFAGHGSGPADRHVVNERDHVLVPPEDPAYTLRRVWLTKEQEEGYYYGVSNEAIWPLCHITFTRPVFRSQDWERYREVNELFAKAVIEEANGHPAFVFIQDYHFGLLPRMLKNANSNLIIAQFWHIPWPNREVFRVFPWKEELLDGLLANDVLGFHTRYHCQNFLDTIDRMVPRALDIHLIVDNYGTHKTPRVRRWFAAHPRFHVHFTPTGASWLNLVERWFAALTQKQIKRGAHRSTRALEATIREYIAVTNEDPKPFIWTKTADEIIDSVARFCQRISNSGH